jgi:hypothetical protein
MRLARMTGHFARPTRAQSTLEEPMPTRIVLSFRWGKRRITLSITIRL